jgi:phosphoribosylanthranilate isomerase
MSLWVKICGNTNLEDALVAVDAGADALGFVFAASPRQVTAAQVKAITRALPASIETYGVFVEHGFEEIVAAVDEAGLSGVQLHANPDPELASRLREHFTGRGAGLGAGRRIQILRVLHYTANLAERLDEAAADPAIDAVLVDSRTAKAVGGTGIAYDWQAARAGFSGHANLRLIAAGGLTPANVAEAIATLEPWGVDVSSGVERSPGRKDHARVRGFIEAARAAGGKLDERWQRVHAS